MPVTVLDVDGDDGAAEKQRDAGTGSDSRAKEISQRVQSTAEKAVETQAVLGESREAVGELHISVRKKDAELQKVLTETSEKGHDLMFVGVQPTTGAKGGYADRLASMISAFAGTTEIITSRGRLPENDADLRILVPVSGTERSMTAAEFALVVAKATGSITRPSTSGRQGRQQQFRARAM